MTVFNFFIQKNSHYQDANEQRGYHTRPTSSASATSTSWSSMTPGGQQFPLLSLCTPQPPGPMRPELRPEQPHKSSDFLRSNHHRGHKTASPSLPHTSKNNVLQQRLAQRPLKKWTEHSLVSHFIAIHTGIVYKIM